MTHHEHEASDQTNEMEESPTAPSDTEDSETNSSIETLKKPTFWIDAALL